MRFSHISNKLWSKNLSVASFNDPIERFSFFNNIGIIRGRNVSYTALYQSHLFILRITKYFLIAGMPPRKQFFSVIGSTFVCYVVIYHTFRFHQYSATTYR